MLIVTVLVMSALLLAVVPAAAQEPVEVRFTCYQDGSECEIYEDLLTRFEEENPDIDVIIENVAYQFILDSLPVNVEVGEGPDIARVTNFPDLSEYYLNLRPLMEDPSLLEDNFNPAVLSAFRSGEDDDGLYGFPDAVTATAPFVNKTLFDQAEVELLGEGASWEEWIAALEEVAETTDVEYAFAIDNRGHRVAGPAMSMGAEFFNEEGEFDLAEDTGFALFAELLKDWLDSGLSPRETWATGDSYTAADQFFSNVQTVMYFSGSWQIGNFAENVGDAFDWVVVPNPTGPGGSTGVAGGAGLVAFESGDEAKNAAIARVMEYLLQPEVYAEFSGRALFIPAHAGAVEVGVEYETEDPQVAAALAAFAAEAAKFQEQAVRLNNHPFAFAYYGASNTRLAQYFAGELTLEEMLERLQEDINDAVANAEAS
jgi:alpha-1,4-digalacturonate transport system substrate-binding protein